MLFRGRDTNIQESQIRTHSCLHRRAELHIEDVAFGGSGVARAGGKIVFVPLTIDGEVVEVQIVEQKNKFDCAELRKVLRSSPERVEPPCPYFGSCGDATISTSHTSISWNSSDAR